MIAGAGPVGLSLALGLLKRGIGVLVFERRPTLGNDPRATTLQPPTLEILSRLGVLDAVLAKGRRVDTLEYWDWVKPERLAAFSFSALAAHTETPFRMHCAQPDLCQVLYDEIERLQPGTVQFGNEVVSFSEIEEGVDVTVRQNGRKRRLRASWLCAADGINSTIRTELGIDLVSTGSSDTFLTFEVGLEADEAHEKAVGKRLADSAYLFTNAGWASFMRLPHSIRVLLLMEEDAPMSNEGLQRTHDTLFGWNNSVPIHNRARYKVQQRQATKLRVGHVILVGDAAHSLFPVAGSSMNSGIHDANTLSQVLLSGGSLDTWEAERLAEIRDRVTAHADATYRRLGARGIFSKRARDRYLRDVSNSPERTVDHLLRNAMLEGRAGPPPLLEEELA